MDFGEHTPTDTVLQHLEKLSKEMADPDLDDAIRIVRQLISKPDVPPIRAQATVVKLAALRAQYTMCRLVLKNWGGAESRKQKDVYYSLEEAIDRLTDAVKYLVKSSPRGVEE